MDPQRWERVSDLLGRALEQPPADRSNWLDVACPDSELRQEVESLLAQDSQVCSALERPPLPLFEGFAGIGPGSRVGPYRVVEELGRGGMGVVYLAEQADDELERRVALKLLKPGLETVEVARRFRVERQILANLVHPGIAELYEGGTTEQGWPYFAMEHIEGERIDRYCDARQLGLEERLELFLRVCAAVRFAHRSLVVHRDLKPANILVTAAGEPKLLDFGIAKWLVPSSAEPLTATAGIRPMTLEYASPEQIRGEPITTATDVHALGLLLYELLTHRRPYPAGGNPESLRRAICESEPVRPSLTVTGALARRLRGDLDTLVLTALAKDPGQRYGSVEQLSDDLRRHLAGLPVLARPATFLYRTGKFLRRNLRQVIAAAVGLAFLAGFLVDRELHQRETSRALTRAERVTEFLTERFEVADPSTARGETITAREVLDRGARRIRRELGDEPEVQSALMHTMGQVYSNLGLYDDAEPLLRDAVALREPPGNRPRQLAESLHALGFLHYRKGQYKSAEQLYRRILAIEPQETSEDESLRAEVLNNLGLVRHAEGNYRGAEELYRRSLALLRKHHGDEHHDVGTTLNNLAAARRAQGDDEEAERLYREALGLRRQLVGEDHPDVAFTLNNLGLLMATRKDFAGAETHFRQALAIFRRLHGGEHPDVALALGNLCGAVHESGRLDEAEQLCRDALAMNRHSLGVHPRVAANLTTLASILIARGQAAEAEPLLHRAAEMFRRTLPPGHWRVFHAESVLGACLTETGRYAEAEEKLTSSYPVLERATGQSSRYSQAARAALARLYEARGEPEKAARYP